jgi:NADH-ubiquinone oxidoreductase chain 5
MRQMGSLASLLPFTYSMMLIGSLSLVGFPFLTGFYSKDVILELAYTNYSISGNFAFWLGSVSVMFTSYYSFRLLFLTFLTPTNAPKSSLANCHDAPLLMAIPFILLAFGSIFVGYLAKDMMIGLGTPFWGNSLMLLPKNELLAESEFATPILIKLIPLVLSSIGAYTAYQAHFIAIRTFFLFKTSYLGRTVYSTLNKRWLFDKVYNSFIVAPCLWFGYEISLKALDKGIFEQIGPFGIASIFRQLGQQMSGIQSGFVYHYALVMLIGLTLCITFIGLSDFVSFFVDTRLYFILLACQVLTFESSTVSSNENSLIN